MYRGARRRLSRHILGIISFVAPGAVRRVPALKYSIPTFRRHAALHLSIYRYYYNHKHILSIYHGFMATSECALPIATLQTLTRRYIQMRFAIVRQPQTFFCFTA